MQRIEPVIKDYAWGSRESLSSLAGRDMPAVGPEAELWVGAHEAGPALVSDEGTTLDAHIASDRQHHLGACRDLFGDRLPFLLKILAADKALSIQAHPDAHRAGSAPAGTYGDSWPKPEAWVPLTTCEAFVGSLPFEDVLARMEWLACPRLSAIVDDAGRASGSREHALLSAVLTLPDEEAAPLVAEVRTGIEAALEAADLAQAEAHALRTIVEVHEQFPGDIGVVVLLTMRHLVMTPGSSYFIHAGVLHSFVRGTTVEILANSDNVVRAGLTPKKIDVPELLRIVDTGVEVRPQPPSPDPTAPEAIRRYESQVPHFALWEVQPGERDVELPGHGRPCLVLVLGAPVSVRCGDTTLTLDKLESAWWPAGDERAFVTGHSQSRIFVASVND